MMTLAEFEDLISAYGAKADHWPLEHRAAMQKLADDDRQAQTLLAQAAQLDEALSALIEAPDPSLTARILDDMHETLGRSQILEFPQQSASRTPNFWAAASLLAACFVGGFVAAPLVIDYMTDSFDIVASLDIISDAFLSSEPL